MAIGANEVATYETRYNCVIGCGSCVSTHATGGNYLEMIGAILESVPPMCLVCGYTMNIISVTKAGGHELWPLLTSVPQRRSLPCWTCTWCNITTLYQVLPVGSDERAERYKEHLCSKCGRPCCWYPAAVPAATPSDAGVATAGPSGVGVAEISPSRVATAGPSDVAAAGPSGAAPPAAKRLRV